MTSVPIHPLARLADLCPSWRSTEIPFTAESRWPRFNPSLCFDGDEFRVVVRTANYLFTDQGTQIFQDDSSLGDPLDVRTKNYIIRFSRQLTLLADPIPVRLPPGLGEPFWHDHLEDLRPFTLAGNMYAVASLYDYQRNKNSMKLIKFGRNGEISAILDLPSPFNKEREKNWMPIIRGNTLHLVYACAPTIIITLDFDGNAISTWSPGEGLEDLQGWSGSSQGCAVGNHTLCVVHKRDVFDRKLFYKHRFVMFDEGLRACALSEPFVLQRPGIEFCAGLALRDDQLLLSYGVNDAEAMLGAMSLRDALNTLTWQDPSQAQSRH